MELFEKCTFSGFKICVPYIGCHPQWGLLFQPNASDSGVVRGTHVKKHCSGASPMVQWLRICLTMQGIPVRSLVWEDPACCRANELVCHNY